MWRVWFCLGVRAGKFGEKTAAKPARAGADQQGGVGSEDTQTKKWHDLGGSPNKAINKDWLLVMEDRTAGRSRSSLHEESWKLSQRPRRDDADQ